RACSLPAPSAHSHLSFVASPPTPPVLPPFPTRRSSDLRPGGPLRLRRPGSRLPPLRCTLRRAIRRRRAGQQTYASPRLSARPSRSEEHTSELQSRENLVCRLLLEKKKYQGSE